MRLTLTEEQQLLESSALDFLAAEYDFRRREASIAHPEGCRPQIWSHFAQLGWLGLPLPESAGGLGGGVLETGLLMRTLGRHLVLEPYHAAIVLAAPLLALLDDGRHATLLQQAVEGTLRLALAHEELGRDTFAPRATMAQRKGGGSWVLRGRKLLAAGAPGASVLLVTATDVEGRARVFRVPADAAGLQTHACQLADGSHAADLAFDELELTADALLAGERDAQAVLHTVLAGGIVAACWEASGTMQAALEQTASYTQQRQQFGQALARFQVVQHRLAEMAVCCEEARAACELAALRLDAPGAGVETPLALASLAKSKVGRSARVVAQEAVQLHGGMGVCEELPVAAMFRKLSAFGQQFGAWALHAERYGASLLASGSWRASQTLLEPGRAAA